MTVTEPPSPAQVKTVCPYCGVGCGMVLHVADGRVVRVSGDKDHPANFGSLCTKGSTVHQTIHTADRLAHAQCRRLDGWTAPGRGGPFERVPLDVALQTVADRLRATIAAHGPDSVALYISGQLSTETQYVANKLTKGFLGTNNIDSNSRLCMASAASGYNLSLGADGPPGHYEDFENADGFLVIGANMADCHPILHQRLRRRVRTGGAKLIVADPRRTATAAGATLYLPLRPGTDLALLNGWLHLLVKMGRVDDAFIAQHTDGWESMGEVIDAYPPARVAELTGLPVDDIIAGAKILADCPRWMSLWTMGLNQSARGTWNVNAICNLHLATGQIGRPGTGPFSLTGQPNAMGGREVGYMSGGLPGQRSVRVAQDRAADRGTVENPAGNHPRASGAAGHRSVPRDGTRRGQGGLDHRQQPGRDDTQPRPRAAWVGTGGICRRAGRVSSDGNLALRPRPVARHGLGRVGWDHDELQSDGDARPARGAATRGCAAGLVAGERGRPADGFRRRVPLPAGSDIFDEIRGSVNPKTGYDVRGISHARLAREGALTWPLAPAENAAPAKRRYVTPDGNLRFPTESGRARFWARPYLPNAEMPDADFPYVLLTGRVAHQWHTRTKTGKVPSLNKLNPGPYLEINRDDAMALGVSEGDPVRIASRRGELRLPARPTDSIQPGNCWAPMHWDELFAADVSINQITSENACPESHQPELKYCPVQLEAVRPANTESPYTETVASR